MQLRRRLPLPDDREACRAGAPRTCIVPGHERPRTELYADELVVDDPPFAFELHGTCAFTRDFEYTG